MADERDLPIELHTFIDESYGPDDYYVGGIVCTTGQYAALSQALLNLRTEIVTKFKLDAEPELHAHEIMQGKGQWEFLRGQVHESVWIGRKVLSVVAASGCDIHFQGVDVRRLNARYRYPDSPYRVCLRHLLERVHDRCVRDSSRSSVTADILDESGAAQAAIDGYSQNPTPGYRPTRLCHIDPMNYVASDTSLGVQAADFVAYSLRRYTEVKRAHPKALRASKQMFDTVRYNIRSNRKWAP